MKRKTAAAAAVAMAFVAGAANAQQDGLVIETRQSAEHGRYLTDASGRTLYAFSADQRGTEEASAKSSCYDACATAWPPVTVERAPTVKGQAEPDLVSTVTREGGAQQATYGGWPLYYFVGDEGRGQATGQGVSQFEGDWHLLAASGDFAAGGPTNDRALFAELQLKSPECVRYDAARDRYLVSNINGEMLARDNDGYISVITANGVSEEKWIAGGSNGVTLNAPKGMALYEDKLLVADIDHLRIFDLESGEPVGAIAIEGAEFLNDMAVDGDGTTYITDTGTKSVPGAIYKISMSGEVARIAEGRDLARPNGIDFDPEGRLIVVTFGGNTVMTVSIEGEVLETKTLAAGQLDGLVVRDDGTMLVSSWKGEHIVRLAADGTAETVVTGLVQPAAFDVDEQHGRLLVPQVKLNEIAVLPLAN